MKEGFFADLHIHSKFSLATSKETSLEELFIYAIIKGITLLGTGDFTHPLWFKEITSKLKENDDVLEPKKSFLAKRCSSAISLLASHLLKNFSIKPPSFILQTEIATISKSDNRTRKVHHIVLMPSINSAAAFIKKIGKYGNLEKDGRAMLKIKPSDLVELALEANELALIIPAHIWTPWYSALGERSGFNSIDECYETSSKYIFAVETGLSSDPGMNRRVSFLDNYLVISNSDAHSPAKIGRECSIFNCKISYYDIYNAIKTGHGFLGTIEHFAEAGKYYFSGHRKCNVCINADNDKTLICPKCGKKLTPGVMQRIKTFENKHSRASSKKSRPFISTLSLQELIAQVYKISSNSSKKLEKLYWDIILKCGTELQIITTPNYSPVEKDFPQLAFALQQMRNHNFHIQYGFDGKYGKISLQLE